ncbi:DUF938 domain-containing protein [Rhodoferax fermentans]|uniref:SAM-dependent methyltransferase n=1 Tax=Rhodoferax fermentans TaxID=28066 RepID=A0A1T1AVS8_RHOFE|nr:DUF938 domain-containing protein [Rhodoferax fermentans]MBK1685213.1 DUF938 domain-containing protein [Rhodoferax fermentans]OOV08157.1 SAM-dependent methyltransferase [Rhodoferax fermentans]
MPPPDFSPSAEQNKHPILDKLLAVLPAQGAALEVASGTGQHAAWFARHLPGWTWQPSDQQPQGFASIQHHVTQAGVSNVQTPLVLDVCAATWLPVDPTTRELPCFDLIFCANMLHIASWEACAGLMRGAARHLAPQGRLITYGPYFEKAVPTTQSNLDFDASLRQRNPAWGVRWCEDVALEAAKAGLQLQQRHPMPANNLLLVWQRVPG